MKVPLVVNADHLPDGKVFPKGFIWPTNGIMYVLHNVRSLLNGSFSCSCRNKDLLLVYEDGKWFMERPEPVPQDLLDAVSSPEYVSSYYKLTPVMLAEERFCEENGFLDYSFGGPFDLCNYEVIRPLLQGYLAYHKLDASSMGVQMVNNYFRDKRYQVIETYYKKNPYISASMIAKMTRFNVNMVSRHLDRLRNKKSEDERVFYVGQKFVEDKDGTKTTYVVHEILKDSLIGIPVGMGYGYHKKFTFEELKNGNGSCKYIFPVIY